MARPNEAFVTKTPYLGTIFEEPGLKKLFFKHKIIQLTLETR